MKQHVKCSHLSLALILILSLTACSGNTPSTESDSTQVPENTPSTITAVTERQDETTAQETSANTDTDADGNPATAIIMNMNGTDVHATLNNTVTAKEFIQLLPYEVTVSRASDDLCGTVSEQLASDNSELSHGWKLGEIGWFGGWFTILTANEEAFANHSVMIIGSVDEADLPYVLSLTGRVDISIRLAEESPAVSAADDIKENTITLTVNGTTMTAVLADNSSAEALKELLVNGPLTIDMRDYASMEKVGSIGTNLPANNEQITTEAGDLILYQGNALVIYYAPNSWNFTRLGKIQDVTADELRTILGTGNVSVTLSLK